MAATRRSKRLSSIGKATSPSTTAVCSEIWHRRQTKHSTLDSDNDDVDSLIAERTWPETEEEENNENCNSTNRMSNSVYKKGKKTAEQVNTPRSRKSCRQRPMPACKAREVAIKRQLDNESSDDESEVEAAGEAHQVSPPKQARLHRKTLDQPLISPTRLLGRLSIDERNVEKHPNCSVEVAEEAEKREYHKASPKTRNKYQNARRVLNSAETNLLPGREQQLQELREFFTESVRNQRSGSLYISGQPGTGKTACLSLLLRSREFAGHFRSVFINCTSIASVGGVYKKLCAELNIHPTGRTERDYLASLHHHLCTVKRMVLIVLDEIDQLCSARQSVLYTIFEWPSLPGAKLLLVGIANSLDLTDRALMRLNARCELKPRLMHFPPYSKQQIVEIFRSRLEEADVLDVFPPVTLQLLAAKVSAVSGDVRRALDIGRRVVEIAEQQKNAGQRLVQLKDFGDLAGDNATTKGAVEEEILKPVQVGQVAAVLNKVYGASQNLEEDIEESFPLQQKIMLCSLLLMLRNERHKDTTMGRLHEVYRRVCAKRNIVALDQAEFSGLVNLVETRGILRIMHKKEPRLNKVQLQWDEEEVNGALCDKQLIASILNDKSCISGTN